MNCHSLPRATRKASAFTLLEVMIAVGILFMCLFGVLALLSNSLRSARILQQQKNFDTGSVAGLIYVQLSNTNNVNEGPVDVDIQDIFPGYKCVADLEEIETNGLCDIEFRLANRSRSAEIHDHFLMYLPNLKKGGISKELPHH